MNESLGHRDETGTHTTTWVPDLLYAGGRFRRDTALVCDNSTGRVLLLLPTRDLRELSGGELPEGEIVNVAEPDSGVIFATRFVRLRGRALLPGMVNAHSHAFQRVIRGRTEMRSSASSDSFWTWREMMYSAAARLTPEDIYDASRMAFTEMLLSGITTVGEFHYLHRTPEGELYEDANLLAKQVCAAARDAGLRVALLRVAYARSGFRQPPNERQRRFIEPDADEFIRHAEELAEDLERESRAGEHDNPRVNERGDASRAANEHKDDVAGDTSAPLPSARAPLPSAWAGVAPHSVRAVPVAYARAVNDFAASRAMPVHMHVAEQPAEVEACLAETGRTPVALLADEGLLGPRFTGVHAVHVTAAEVASLARARANVCACPTTERNLGDGVVPADDLFAAGVSVALGTDSHAQIDLLEDARELEYHLRLKHLARNVLAPAPDDATRGGAETSAGETRGGAPEASALAARLFECATVGGARSVGATHAGELTAGRAADFFTVDLDDPSIAGAGADDLLASIVFSLSRAAVREVAVGGRLVVEEGRHAAQSETVARFTTLQKRLWG
ncbi:MAG TPA: formimidoylglutamate deiminase [Pyrinomonadaceae bacterium]|nr:formimidoylglutamate deiminase [Pyrinomonadaceae bacterium]